MSPEEWHKQQIEAQAEGQAGQMRVFGTGATRHTDEGKLDFEGFLSPLVVQRYAEYLQKHSIQADGQRRPSDNWQKGIPLPAYMKSLWRHFLDAWKAHRGYSIQETIEDALCGVIFNASGYLHEIVKKRLPAEPYTAEGQRGE